MNIYEKGFPAVIKVSHAHAGMGKAKVPDIDGFGDVRTIMALTGDYGTAEPYIKPAYGIRVQKTGNNYRVYKKVHTGAGWKSHFGGADLQFLELNDTFKLWVDECAKCYGGMELLAVDAICDENDNYHILELNGSAIGIQQQFWKGDSVGIVDMAIDKMNKIYVDKKESVGGQGFLIETAADWEKKNDSIKQVLEDLKKLDLEKQLREKEEPAVNKPKPEGSDRSRP